MTDAIVTVTHYTCSIKAARQVGEAITLEWCELLDWLFSHGTDTGVKGSAGYVAAAPVHGQRNGANTRPTRVIALDWDKPGAPEFDPAVVAGLEYFAYTTDSHLQYDAKTNPTAGPRWRVWVLLDREYSEDDIRAAVVPWAGAVLRHISQPVFLPTRCSTAQSCYGEGDALRLSDWVRPTETPPAPRAEYVPPAHVTQPSRASTQALATRWHTDPTETNRLAGAVGAVLGGEWGWSDQSITEYFETWLQHPDLGRHLDSALRAAATRRAGGRVQCFPELEKLIGQPYTADAPTGQDVSALILSQPEGPPPDDELRKAMGGTWVQGQGMVEVVAPPRWLVKSLGLAPGRYTGLSGFASAGKTWLAQGLALAVATGQDFCGMPVRQGAVLHIDHEQGVDMTRERYQLLGATGTPDLAFVSFPAWRLSGEGGKVLLAQLARNRALIIIDSLRASVGGDENSSEVRQWLDGASEVSDATGCVVLVLHHAKKGSDGADDIYKARGSGGIVDAAGAFWHLDLQERDDAGARAPSILSQTKPGRHPPGGVLPPTAFIITPSADGASVHLSLSNDLSVSETPDIRAEDCIIEALQGKKRFASVEELRASAGIKKPVFNSALARLKARGSVEKVDGFYTLV